MILLMPFDKVPLPCINLPFSFVRYFITRLKLAASQFSKTPIESAMGVSLSPVSAAVRCHAESQVCHAENETLTYTRDRRTIPLEIQVGRSSSSRGN
jgi:EamA domain-containing membrane protein RarD